MFGRERGERLWRFAGATADFVLDLVARHGPRLRGAARHLDPGHSFGESGREARGSAYDDWLRSAAHASNISTAASRRDRGHGQLHRRLRRPPGGGAAATVLRSRELARASVADGRRAAARRIARRRARRAGGGWRAIDGPRRGRARGTSSSRPTRTPIGLVPGLARSIVAAEFAADRHGAASRRRCAERSCPNGETLSDTRRVIRYWRLDDAAGCCMGGRGPYREPEPERDWAISRATCARSSPHWPTFPSRIAGADVSRCMSTTCRACIGPTRAADRGVGCQGRGIGWQTAMGAELARIVVDARIRSRLAVLAGCADPVASAEALGVATTIAAYRALDRLGLELKAKLSTDGLRHARGRTRGRIAMLTFNRPKVLNAFDPGLIGETMRRWRRSAQDDAFRPSSCAARVARSPPGST